MSGVYTVEAFRRAVPRETPTRPAPTTWNGRNLDPHEQAIIAEGLAQELEQGHQLIAGCTS
jgi:hypothetical protein